MEYEDSTKALFPEPNAYIQNCVHPKPKKAVFAEPYENLPPFYLNNNFKAGDCGVNCDCNFSKPNCGCNNNQNFGGGLNLNSLLPIISTLLGKNSNVSAFMPLIKALGDGKNMDITKLITTILSNKDTLKGFSNLLGNKKKEPKHEDKKNEIPTTEFPIDNYTKIEGS